MSNVELRLTGGPDPAEVRDRMIALKEPERRKLAEEAQKDFESIIWRGAREQPSKRWRAAALAWVGTTTARKLSAEFWRIGFEFRKTPDLVDDVYAILAARGRHFFETLVRGLLRDESAVGWPLVRRAVREGLIDRPDDPAYASGMVWGVSPMFGRAALDDTYNGLLADPTILDDDVWLVFEHDVAGTLANANTWVETGEEVAPGFPKYARGENRWIYALVRLVEEGRLDRQRALDASLDSLMRDFRESSVGWYATLHEALEPTRDERRARVDRYLGLLTSSAPAAVRQGLTALKALDEFPAQGFGRAAPAIFAHRQKSLPLETLKVIEAQAKANEPARADLLAAAAHALAHERADVQERGLKLLERYPEQAPRGELLTYVDVVSPTLRERVAALTGVALAAPVVVVDAFPEPRVVAPAPGERLEPVRDVDELIELAAALLEDHGNGDDADRFLDGVARLCAERPARFKERTAGLVKQAGPRSFWQASPASGRDLVAIVVRAWTRGERPKATRPKPTFGGLLAHRAFEVASRAKRRRPRALLAFPTHAGGWLDDDAVRARDTAGSRFLRRDGADPYDRLAARLRTIRGEALDLRAVLHKTGEHTRLKVERGPLPRELAGVREVDESLARIGRNAREWWSEDFVWLSGDMLGARWLLSVAPAFPEIQYARAASAIVDFVDASVYRHPEVVLEHMLSPSAPMRDPAWDAVAGALLAKSPDLQRLAADVLVATVEDERFDATKLGRALARLLDQGVGATTRLRQPLRDAGRVSPLHAAQLVRAVGTMVAELSTTPHGLQAPLDAAAELSASCGYRVGGTEREALERLAGTVSPSAKLAKLARALVAS